MAIRIDRVVTRGGDGGETSLGDGSRVPKTDPRIAAIGTVDELNAVIGLLRATPGLAGPIAATLIRLQNDLFDLGADLCVPGQGGDRLRLSDSQVLRLDEEIAAMNATLPPLTSFVLPGGTEAAARAHVARAVARRAERALVAVAGLNPAIGRYINRLSDHLFVLARVLNEHGARDTLWVPGEYR
jgi:cob(I)alamin adenosyltransferase